MIVINGIKYKTYDFDEIDQNKYVGFIYVTINEVNSKKYVGQHTKFNKNYLGSGTSLTKAIEKYGRENFKRYIIDISRTQSELNDLETEYINNIFNAVKDKNWYNIKDGSQTGGSSIAGFTEEQRKDFCHKGRRPIEVFKNGEYFGEFPTIKEFAYYLKEKGYSNHAEHGCFNMVYKNWKPTKGNLKGWSARFKGGKIPTPSLGGKKNVSGGAKSILVWKDDNFVGEFPSIFEFAKTLGAKTSSDAISRGARFLTNGKVYSKGRFKGYKSILKSEYKN